MFRPRNPAIRLIAVLISVGGLAYGAVRARNQNSTPPASPLPQSSRLPQSSPLPRASPLPQFVTDPAILTAIERHRYKVWGQAAGVVDRLLDDDRKGTPHQRFVLRIESGATILLEYNIDLAPRIEPLEVGDSVIARGEYIWNDKGGLMHWLHHDPSGAPGGGWVRVRGKTYQ